MQPVNVKSFIYGLVTRVEKESIPRGAASDSKNWLTKGDRIELRRGQALLGEIGSGITPVTGLFVGTRFDGTQIPFKTHDRKIKYYNSSASPDDWAEIGTNTLPADANEEEVAMDEYHSLAGAAVYISSQNSSIYKVMIANPASITDLLSTTHRGKIKIKRNRMYLWGRGDANTIGDPNGVYLSYIDKDELSDYTAITGESIGASGSTNYAGTLAFKAAGAKRTCHYVIFQATVAAGTETFVDDRNGNLTSNFGGAGTVNYTTGAYDITFSAVTTGAVTSDYYHEDATSTGIADFTKGTPRTAGQAAVFRQDDGGAQMQNMGSIGDDEYCIHERKTWVLTLTATDTGATNFIYRNRVGVENWRAVQETGDGVYYIDSIDQNQPAVRILEKGQLTTDVLPRSLSEEIDLADYRFDKGVLFEWGEYLCVLCRHKSSTVNDTMFIRSNVWSTRERNVWDKLDYRASTLADYNGTLIGGDSASENVYTLFSGFDDDDSVIPNFWVSGKDNLDVEGVKVVNRFVIAGLIQPAQKLKISISLDNSAFVEIGGSDDNSGNHTYAIQGDGSYVDQGQSVSIGSNTIGSVEVGGGSAGAVANPYRKEFVIATDRFEFIRVKYEAVDVGFVSVSEYGWRDIRYKGKSLPNQYVS